MAANPDLLHSKLKTFFGYDAFKADQEQIIRLTNENIVITKDELNIDYDLVINVGLGPGTKEAQIQYLMVMINQIYPQLAQAGLVTPKSWYNII